MNKLVNPYESSSAPDVRTSSRFSPNILFAAGLWVAIAIGVAFGRYKMVPIYDDFGVELPVFTKILLHPLGTITFFAIAIGISLLAFVMPSSRSRNRVVLVAIVLAIPTGVLCFYGFLGPLFALIHSLS